MTAKKEEIGSKHDELQAAMAHREECERVYAETLVPYRAARQALIDALVAEGNIENELEDLLEAHEPPDVPPVG
jgi:hypothetical protein